MTQIWIIWNKIVDHQMIYEVPKLYQTNKVHTSVLPPPQKEHPWCWKVTYFKFQNQFIEKQKLLKRNIYIYQGPNYLPLSFKEMFLYSKGTCLIQNIRLCFKYKVNWHPSMKVTLSSLVVPISFKEGKIFSG